MLHPQSIPLAEAWIRTFWAANQSMTWTHVEEERSLWLSPNTLLLGKIDARGLTEEGKPFFLDNKTASKSKARFIADEKARWRMSPQALTYGVLNSAECRLFTVRWAFKTDPPTADFEWYSYSDAELDWWKAELLGVAKSIRDLRTTNAQEQWPVNLLHCTRYGENYKCPFRDQGCWAQNFAFVPESMRPRTESHLDIENTLNTRSRDGGGIMGDPDIVVLDASRVGDWMACNELYRRLWEGDGLTEDNEALTIGTDFHSIVGSHLRGLIKKEKNEEGKEGSSSEVDQGARGD